VAAEVIQPGFTIPLFAGKRNDANGSTMLRLCRHVHPIHLCLTSTTFSGQLRARPFGVESSLGGYLVVT